MLSDSEGGQLLSSVVGRMCPPSSEERPASHRRGDVVAPPKFYKKIPLVATSVSLPRVLYDAIGEVCACTGETRSAVVIRYCLHSAISELKRRNKEATSP